MDLWITVPFVPHYTVTHRAHRPKLWIYGQHPCCPHTHSPTGILINEEYIIVPRQLWLLRKLKFPIDQPTDQLEAIIPLGLVEASEVAAHRTNTVALFHQ